MLKRYSVQTVLLLFLLMLPKFLSAEERIVVFQFKSSRGIAQNDVEGITKIFVSYFQPKGCTVVDPQQVDKKARELGFSTSALTKTQMLQVGKALNATMYVGGEVHIVDGQYKLVVKANRVSTGVQTHTDEAIFEQSLLFVSVKSLAESFSSLIIDNSENKECFVDLGLLTGTVWASENIKLKYGLTVVYPDNFRKYVGSFCEVDYSMPSLAQWKELLTLCKWEWKGMGFKVVGPNGKWIYIPACGDENGDYIGEKLVYCTRDDNVIIITSDGKYTVMSSAEGFVRLIK